jgi:hypothetical protein
MSELVVRTSGLYFIYVQMTYTGRMKDAVTMPACSHQLMLQYDRPGNISNLAKPESLLQGTLTQYKLGRRIFVKETGDDVSAYDSVYTAGVFELAANDRLYLTFDSYSIHCTVSDHSDKTFIGGYLIQRRYN